MISNNINSQGTMLRYKILLIILFPFILFITIRDAIRRQGGLAFIYQRFGIGYIPQKKQPIWFHAASVGEVNAALPLIKIFLEKTPNSPITVTTSTPTGARILKQKLGCKIQHYYLPLDYKFAINRFLKSINPVYGLILETEIWPQLFAVNKQRKIPLYIINGRLSYKTLNTFKWLRKTYPVALDNVSYVLARSQKDKERFLKLGMPAEKIDVIGNIKFAQNEYTVQEKFIQRPYILAASTHANEENLLSDIWQQLISNNWLLAIAPRHPERRKEIIQYIKSQGLEVAIRSKQQAISDTTNIYLIDTLGEMDMFMQHADIVFTGGSLIPRGGQNILEPARHGRTIITGPHMENFEDETNVLLKNKALIQIKNIKELEEKFQDLINHSEKRISFGENAYTIMQERQNIHYDYYDNIQNLIKAPNIH